MINEQWNPENKKMRRINNVERRMKLNKKS